MQSGKLCYLDFGMVSYVEANQRYSIIEAVVHLVNRDFNALTELYKRMGFIPNSVNPAPIVSALEQALPDVLSAPVGELNIKNVIQKLGDVMYKFPFSLPPFYIAIIRCLGVLEGLAIQIDKDFRIINDAYPYVASRLLTDQSEELQEALRQLLFKNDEPRWERLKELLEKASSNTDYDASLAADQLIAYLVSEQGKPVREIFVSQTIEIIDEIGAEAFQYALVAAPQISLLSLGSTVIDQLSGEGQGNIRDVNGNLDLSNILRTVLDKVAQEAAQHTAPSEKLVSAVDTLRLFSKNGGDISPDALAEISRKISREPVMVEAMSTIISALAEKTASRFVGSIFAGSDGANTSAKPA